LLDLGCGTGELALPLASYFKDAIGIDPCRDMLDWARSKAKQQGNTNIHWVQEKAEDIEASIGPVRLTTAGASFHWMRQALVLEKTYALTEDGGGMVFTNDGSPFQITNEMEGWKINCMELIEKYLGSKRRAGNGYADDLMDEARPVRELIAESPFRTFECKSYGYKTERTFEELIGYLYSTSYAAKRLFENRYKEFERELRSALLRLVPSGNFVEERRIEAYFLIK
jgi:SAM-dependent methyltransferase